MEQREKMWIRSDLVELNEIKPWNKKRTCLTEKIVLFSIYALRSEYRLIFHATSHDMNYTVTYVQFDSVTSLYLAWAEPRWKTSDLGETETLWVMTVSTVGEKKNS